MGVAVGLMFGVPLVLYTHRTGISFGEGTEEIMAEYGMSPMIHPLLTPAVLGYAITIVMAVSLVLAVYPAVKAARLAPVEALRHR
jgi:ABC-type antimicrobial peptide transport system permease subunit